MPTCSSESSPTSPNSENSTPTATATSQEYRQAVYVASVLQNAWLREKPTERQAAFLFLDCPEAMYGGSAGGGKSSALLMAALQFVDVPGYAALLLRRSFSDLSLPGALMA